MRALPLTLDEFEQLDGTDGIQELLDGVLVQLAPPQKRHSDVCMNVFDRLRRLTARDRVRLENGFVIGKHCLQPDVAVTFPDQATERGWFSGAPMIAIEVASRGNTPEELEWKKELYLSNGSHEVWLVYDKTHTVAVHQPGGRSMAHRDSFVSLALSERIGVPELFGDAPDR